MTTMILHEEFGQKRLVLDPERVARSQRVFVVTRIFPQDMIVAGMDAVDAYRQAEAYAGEHGIPPRWPGRVYASDDSMFAQFSWDRPRHTDTYVVEFHPKYRFIVQRMLQLWGPLWRTNPAYPLVVPTSDDHKAFWRVQHEKKAIADAKAWGLWLREKGVL